MKRKSLSATKKNLNFHIKKLRNSFVKSKYIVFSKNLKSLNLENKKILIAVSGGIDSLSLLYLSKCYSLIEKVKLHPVIVDHKIRKESTKEALKLKNILNEKFKINCKILSSKNLNFSNNIQSKARDLRYNLIFKECKKEKIDHIFLGHHKDDLFENFFIRLLRGSGLKGLISFNNFIVKYKNFKIVRPILNFSKDDLILMNDKTYGYFIEDPSNFNDKFLRVRVRKLLKNLSNEGLDFKKFKLTLENLSKSEKVIEYFVDQNIRENSKYLKKHNRVILTKSFFDKPDEIVFRSFTIAIQHIAKNKNYTRGKKVLNLIKMLNSTKKIGKSTLSRCIFEKIGDSVVISQEK